MAPTRTRNLEWLLQYPCFGVGSAAEAFAHAYIPTLTLTLTLARTLARTLTRARAVRP